MTTSEPGEVLRAFGANEDDWDLVMAVGDALPPSVRIAVAAIASRHLGENKTFIDLLEAAVSPATLLIDDWFIAPPPDLSTRLFLRAWLRGFDDRHWVPNDPPSADDDKTNKPLLMDLAAVRGSDLTAIRLESDALRTPRLRKLAGWLGGAASAHDQSPLVAFLVAYRRGHLLYLEDSLSDASLAYQSATEILSRRCPPTTQARFQAHLQLLSIALREGRDGAIEEVFSLRKRLAGGKNADVVAYELGRQQFDEAIVRGGLPQPLHLPIAVHETLTTGHALHAYETAAEDALRGRHWPALAMAGGARLTALDAGLASLLVDIEALRGRTHLRRQDFRSALVAYVKSGRNDVAADLESMPSSEWLQLVSAVRPDDLKLLRAVAESSRRPFRITAYANIVAALLGSKRAYIKDRLPYLEEAARLAIEEQHTLSQNVAAGTSAAKAILSVLEQDAAVAVRGHCSVIRDVGLALSDGTKPWHPTQVGLSILFYACQIDEFTSEPGSAETIAEHALRLLEAAQRPGEQWPILGPGFGLLTQRRICEKIAENDNLTGRTRKALARHFGGNKRFAEIHAVTGIKLLSCLPSTPPGDLKTLVDAAIDAAANVHSSDAMPGLVRLLQVRDVLSADALARITDSVIEFLSWRSSKNEPAFSVGVAPHAIFELSSHEHTVPDAELQKLYRCVFALLRDYVASPWKIAQTLDGSPQPKVLTNWVHCLLTLGRRVEKLNGIDDVLDAIASHDKLATRAVYRGRLNAAEKTTSASAVALASADVFYSGVARLLANPVVDEVRDEVLRNLVRGALEFGPRATDVGIFAWARHSTPTMKLTPTDWKPYMWRLDGGAVEEETEDVLRALVSSMKSREAQQPQSPSSDLRIDDLSRLRAALHEPSLAVELDVESPHPSGSLAAAQRMEKDRQARLSAGERVARIMRIAPQGGKERVFETGVNTADARALLEAGATWIGPEQFDPRR